MAPHPETQEDFERSDQAFVRCIQQLEMSLVNGIAVECSRTPSDDGELTWKRS